MFGAERSVTGGAYYDLDLLADLGFLKQIDDSCSSLALHRAED
jgi:hypothetical protein